LALAIYAVTVMVAFIALMRLATWRTKPVASDRTRSPQD